MKHFAPLLLALTFLGSLSACKTNYQMDLLNANLWYQHASEYRAIAFQTYNMAQGKLDHILKSVRFAKPPCIVLDLDETCLNNSPYAGFQVKNNKSFNLEDWREWTSKMEADTIPGCVSFLKWADKQNVEIFYVSNRGVDELDATVLNMQKFGFPKADKDHVMLRAEVSSKQPRRAVIEEDHTIVMLFGDNLNDISEIWEKKSTEERNQLVNENRSHFGYDYIILPNPGYGSWQSALLDYQRGMKDKEKNQKKVAKLKSFK